MDKKREFLDYINGKIQKEMQYAAYYEKLVESDWENEKYAKGYVLHADRAKDFKEIKNYFIKTYLSI